MHRSPDTDIAPCGAVPYTRARRAPWPAGREHYAEQTRKIGCEENPHRRRSVGVVADVRRSLRAPEAEETGQIRRFPYSPRTLHIGKISATIQGGWRQVLCEGAAEVDDSWHRLLRASEVDLPATEFATFPGHAPGVTTRGPTRL